MSTQPSIVNEELDLEAGLEASLHEVGPGRSLGADAWRRFKRNRLAMLGLVLVAFLAKFEILGHFWARYAMGG